MKTLPLGINTLSSIRFNDMVYIDKTEIAWRLVRMPGRYFLSRPRRFGKSLFVDTLKEIFEGNQVLFEGLYIHEKWDWSITYPVIKIDFASGTLQNREDLDKRIWEILRQNQSRLGVECHEKADLPGYLENIILNAYKKYDQRVVILVDEYDKPILDNIDNPEIAAQMREGLKNLYSVFKGQDAHIHFVFMTGVSKFSKVSLFSGLNQLKDITISEDYAIICGYTHEDLQSQFGEHLQGVDWDKVRLWYNGYKWLGDVAVYNPYDILLFLSEKKTYRNYWFETGNPSFLIKLFTKYRYFLPDLEDIVVTEEILDSFDVEKINPLTLLFQTGYLTIDKTFTRRQRMMFALKIPNLEVKLALSDQFINGYTDLVNEKNGYQDNLYDCLEQGDLPGMESVVRRLFASIPYRNFTNNHVLEAEGYYASVLYAFFLSLDAEIIPEDVSNHGQVDMTVKLSKHIYVMEIKLIDEDSIEYNPALEQIKNKGYAEKYQGQADITVHEVGFVFSKAERNLVKCDWA